MPEPLGAGGHFFDRRSALLVEVRSDDGIAGWGETWHSPPVAWTIIETTLAPAILGQDPLEYLRLWADMHERLGYERQGPGLMALSAVDMALWDLRGRALRQPIARLLGGPSEPGCPLCQRPIPSTGPRSLPGVRRVEAERIIRPGFRAMKMKVGVDPSADGRAARAVRKVVGPDVILLADANQVYTTRPAIEAGRQLEEEGFAWLEEPVAPDDVEAYAHVAERPGLAVVGGEALGGIRAFRTFFERGALDVAQPDVSIAGGFTEVMRIAALAAAWEVPVIPHVWGTAINLYASLQLCAVLRGLSKPHPHRRIRGSSTTSRPIRSRAVGCPRGRAGRHGGGPAGPWAGDRSGPTRLPPYLQRYGEVTQD